MKLVVQLEDDAHVITLSLERLLRLLRVELTEDEIKRVVLHEIARS